MIKDDAGQETAEQDRDPEYGATGAVKYQNSVRLVSSPSQVGVGSLDCGRTVSLLFREGAAGLLGSDVLGVPVGPVLVPLTNLLLVLAVGRRSPTQSRCKLGRRRERDIPRDARQEKAPELQSGVCLCRRRTPSGRLACLCSGRTQPPATRVRHLSIYRSLGRAAQGSRSIPCGRTRLPPPPGRPRAASWARSRARCAWIIAPIIRPLQINSPHFSRRIRRWLVRRAAAESPKPHFGQARLSLAAPQSNLSTWLEAVEWQASRGKNAARSRGRGASYWVLGSRRAEDIHSSTVFTQVV